MKSFSQFRTENQKMALQKKIQKVSSTSAKGKAAVTLPTAPWDKKKEEPKEERGMPPKAAAYKAKMDKKFGKIPEPGTKDFKTVVNKMRKAAGMKIKRKFKEEDAHIGEPEKAPGVKIVRGVLKGKIGKGQPA